jgi:deoxyribonuclease-2
MSFLSVALKKPNGTSYGWTNVLPSPSDGWVQEEDVNVWIRHMMSRHPYRNWLFYNDDEPDNEKGTNVHSRGAHAKGVVVWNDNVIGWLIHSVPNYPERIYQDSGLRFPDILKSQLIYGQSFCYIEIGYQPSTLQCIFSQLKKMDAHVYDEHNEHNEDTEDNQKEQKESDDEKSENNKIVNVHKMGENIFHLSKNSKWGKDLYEDFICDYINEDILCETWAKPSIPSSPRVKNVKTCRWSDVEYTSTNDHSKYAVSMNQESPWVFIGDINRMESQSRRGGGGLLIKNNDLWTRMNEIIVSFTEIHQNPNFCKKPVKTNRWWEYFECFTCNS